MPVDLADCPLDKLLGRPALGVRGRVERHLEVNDIRRPTQGLPILAPGIPFTGIGLHGRSHGHGQHLALRMQVLSQFRDEFCEEPLVCPRHSLIIQVQTAVRVGGLDQGSPVLDQPGRILKQIQ